MRHGKKFNHLGRTASHRKAMLANMASSLILSKRIQTTVAKAKALRVFVEPILTKAKEDTMHNRRISFSYLKNKYAVKELFSEVAEKISDRNGGYCRIIRLGVRKGDNAEMAIIELVDFNDVYTSKKETKKSSGRRRRRSKTKTTPETPIQTVETVPTNSVDTEETTPKEEAKPQSEKKETGEIQDEKETKPEEEVVVPKTAEKPKPVEEDKPVAKKEETKKENDTE